MPERERGAGRPSDERTEAARQADHAAIDRLADELLPSLVARLGASGLGELEVREGAWRVRLRRPASAERRVPAGGRAAPGRGGAKTPVEDGRGRERVGAADPSTATQAGDSSGTSRPSTDPLPPLTAVILSDDLAPDTGPAVATSPAVGIYRSRADLRAGVRVRAGDRLGSVDVLGVAVEVSAPVDGIVATAIVEDGDAVEYGQPLLALEPLGGPGGSGAADPARGGS